jgi:Sulfotransferase domain
MPVQFHRHLRRICLSLVVIIGIGFFKLRFLSDPADVDTKLNQQPYDTPNGSNGSHGSYTANGRDGSSSDGLSTSRSDGETANAVRDTDTDTGTSPTQTMPSTKATATPFLAPAPSPRPKSRPASTPQQQKQQNQGQTVVKLPTSVSIQPTPITNTNSTAWHHDTVNNNGTIQQTKLHYKNEPVQTQSNSGASFVEDYCALETAEWYPSKEGTAWQKRAPYLVLAGTLEAGIPSITKQLVQHSLLQENRHSSFFLPNKFRPYLTSSLKPKIWSARQHLYAKDYPVKDLKAKVDLKTIDASTGYLFWSSTVPQQLLCTCPWTKIIVFLRNPVDRLAAQYQSAVALGLKLDIESWLDPDLQLLQDTHDLETWSAYLKSTRGDAPIGRGMYELQLQHWLSVLAKMDKLNDILILSYEDWKRHPRQVWSRILEFLQLPEETPSSLPLPTEFVHAKMDPALRKKLIKYYQPYNQKLYDLLGWDNVWDT